MGAENNHKAGRNAPKAPAAAYESAQRDFEETEAERDAQAFEMAAGGPRFTDADTPETFLGKGGRFEKLIPGFVPREGQVKLAQAASEAIKAGTLLIAEAGTGTGKTFAYLVPALLSGRTVVISTASKALQDQLLTKDLPRIFELLKLPRAYMALKGFSNYLCIRRFADYEQTIKQGNALGFEDPEDREDEEELSGKITPGLFQKLKAYEVKCRKQVERSDEDCRFCELDSGFPKAALTAFGCDRNLCTGRKCPHQAACYALLARQKAARCKVVVINHALFFSDLQIEDNFDAGTPCILLPKYQVLILDEAHELAENGRSHLGQEVSWRQVRRYCESLEETVRSEKLGAQSDLKLGKDRILDAFARLNDYLRDKGGISNRNFLFYRYDDYEEGDPQGKKYQKPAQPFRDAMAECWQRLAAVSRFLLNNEEADEDLFKSLRQTADDMRGALTALMHIDDEKDENAGRYVGSVSISRHGFSLRRTPLEIGPYFGAFLRRCEEHRAGVVMTSATLSVAGKFGKFRNDIGANSQSVKELTVESCFDYPHHAALFVSESFPPAQEQGREARIIAMLKELIDATSGGVFFLTTSNAALAAAAEALKKTFPSRLVLSQNSGRSNNTLLRLFRENGKAILAGTSSFWAGVDVQGRALSLVVIDKLPFTAPGDPIYKARCDLCDSRHGKRSHFMEISVPEAVIELRQGVGRLIRHETDRGALVICDPRVVTKGYGKIFMGSLPKVRICKSVTELADFMKEISKDPK